MTSELDHQMTDSNETLSSLMDGELDAERQRFFFSRLSNDSSLALTWRRYHLVRACLHKEMVQSGCIADRVSAAISLEDSPKSAGASIARLPHWVRPLAGGAIAASAALFAIVAINSSLLQRTQTGPDSQPGFVAQPNVLDQNFARQPTPVGYAEMSQTQRQRLNTFVLHHNQAAGGSSFVSFIPIVSGGQAEEAEDDTLIADQPEAATPERQPQGR